MKLRVNHIQLFQDLQIVPRLTDSLEPEIMNCSVASCCHLPLQKESDKPFKHLRFAIEE